jgi:hypothetical protein
MQIANALVGKPSEVKGDLGHIESCRWNWVKTGALLTSALDREQDTPSFSAISIIGSEVSIQLNCQTLNKT